VIIIRDAYTYQKAGYHSENKEDFFQAKNDTAAFDSAAKAFYLNIAAEKRTLKKLSVSHSFMVSNSIGVNLETVLPKILTDSIKLRYIKLMTTDNP
jgi:hypothetical protein